MSDETSWIQDVWSYNLESEMKILRELVERYPYISMVSFLFIYIYINFIFYFAYSFSVEKTRKQNKHKKRREKKKYK